MTWGQGDIDLSLVSVTGLRSRPLLGSRVAETTVLWGGFPCGSHPSEPGVSFDPDETVVTFHRGVPMSGGRMGGDTRSTSILSINSKNCPGVLKFNPGEPRRVESVL